MNMPLGIKRISWHGQSVMGHSAGKRPESVSHSKDYDIHPDRVR
jgi:hypothetical protein